MRKFGIALDLGTSGFRAQAIDLEKSGKVLSTAVTIRHPLPGANVMDHLHCTIEIGSDWAHETVVRTVNRIIQNLRIDTSQVARIAVCGNPIQLSIFQNIEIRDLAYAGKRKLKALGVTPPDRDAQILKARDLEGLALPGNAELLIPPAVRHEIGADALAMMIQTGMLEREGICIATDYGTNAEMALIVNGKVYTGSTAAGPAIEGQQIQNGMLALPGAISDVDLDLENGALDPLIFDPRMKSMGPVRLTSKILDHDMMPRRGPKVDPLTGEVVRKGEIEAVGITGTGVVALISQGLQAGIIRIPRIVALDGQIHLPEGIHFTEKDLMEAGKAIGAIRAGHITLCQESGIRLDDIDTAYMSGATGTYVDALKAREIGMIPSNVKKIYQVGNTSLTMACDLVKDVNTLWRMKSIADELRQHHCMFAESHVFKKVYILELSHWTEGMPMRQYQEFLRKYGLPPLPSPLETPEVIKTVAKDIPDAGSMGLQIIGDLGQRKTICFEDCTGDEDCVEHCPENALSFSRQSEVCTITIDPSLCNGVACRRCEEVCEAKVFDLIGALGNGTPTV